MTTALLIVLLTGIGLGAAKWFLQKESGKTSPENANAGSGEEASYASLESEAVTRGKKDLERAIQKSVDSRMAAIVLNRMPVFSEEFCGRKKIIKNLVPLIETTPLRVAFQGPPGMGKTSLGLAFTRMLYTKYRDDHLFFDMRGTTSHPLSPREVMARCIHHFRPAEMLPENERELIRLYKAVLKDKKALLFLDNVPGAEAVKKLIPPPQCALILTSVEPLAAQGIVSFKPGLLDPEDANLLIQGISVRIGYWGNEIAKLCQNHPLAVTLAARYVTAHPHEDTDSYLENLRKELTGPASSSGKKAKKPPADAAFKVSYQKLAPAAVAVLQKTLLFRDRFDANAHAFICEDENNEQLGHLLLHGLIMTDKESHRYFLHDQIRKYLEARVNTSTLILARKRLASFYLTQLLTARDLYDQGGKPRQQGLNLFDLEWENIQAGRNWAEEFSQKDSEADKLCLSYAETASPLLLARHPADLCLAWFQAALESARRQGDEESESRYLLQMGRLYNRLTQHSKALEILKQALERFHEAEDAMGERETLGHLGLTYMALGKPHQAIEHLEQELKAIAESEDKNNEENVLQRLGQIYQQVGENLRAMEYYQKELDLARDQEDTRRLSRVLGDLGQLHSLLKNQDSAIEAFEEALGLIRKAGDKSAEIRLYQHLGDAQMEAGKVQKALAFFESGLTLAKDKGESLAEAQLLGRMGAVNLKWEKFAEAVSCLEKAANLFQNLGNRRKEGETLWNLSQALEKNLDKQKASACGQKALAIYKEVNHPEKGTLEKALRKMKPAEKQEPAPSPGKSGAQETDKAPRSLIGVTAGSPSPPAAAHTPPHTTAPACAHGR